MTTMQRIRNISKKARVIPSVVDEAGEPAVVDPDKTVDVPLEAAHSLCRTGRHWKPVGKLAPLPDPDPAPEAVEEAAEQPSEGDDS